MAAGGGVLVDARDRRLYDNAHAAGAVSLPLADADGPEGRARAEALAGGRTLILYCA
ncbi:MAG: rhodanese-like domain-containing protein [Gemmatimonadales bacterium]